jgi:hypothetical protein
MLLFVFYDKLPEKVNLMEERFILTQFQRYVCDQLTPLLFGLWQGRNIMVEWYGIGNLLILWWQEKGTQGGIV